MKKILLLSAIFSITFSSCSLFCGVIKKESFQEKYCNDPILGCTDKKAENYNPEATKDDGSCIDPVDKVSGCTDKNAVNYNKLATLSDGSCKYDKVITDYNISVNDLIKLQKGMTKGEVLSVTKLFPYEIYHNVDNCEIHVYNYSNLLREFEADIEHKKAGLKTGEDIYSNERKQVLLYYRDGLLDNIITEQAKSAIVNAVLCFNNTVKESCNTNDTYIKCLGCTDQEALNYNNQANLDDGSCKYPVIIVKGCMDVEALNYDKDALEDNGSCEYCPCNYKPNPDYDPKRNCGEKCIPEFDFIAGCMDEGAINYNPEATKSDKSCKYCPCDTENYYYVLNESKNCEGDPCIKVEREKEKEVVNDKDCSLCDFIELNGKIGIELKTTGTITDNE